MSRKVCARSRRASPAWRSSYSADRHAVGVVVGLEHERRHRGDEHDLGDPRGAVAADVPGHLAAAGREADEGDVPEVEVLDQLGQVVGVGVHLVAVPGLARAAVPAAIVGDDAEAVRREEQHLRVPAVGVQRPAVAEDDGWTVAPVLVEDLGAVSGW